MIKFFLKYFLEDKLNGVCKLVRFVYIIISLLQMLVGLLLDRKRFKECEVGENEFGYCVGYMQKG